MRYVERKKASTPFILRSNEAKAYRSEVTRYLQSYDRGSRPPKPPSWIFNAPELRNSLRNLYRDACAYCETPLHREGEIDPFRPHEGAEGFGRSVAYGHYCWLTLEWNNLHLACDNCRREKRNRFPVDTRGEVGMSLQQLRQFEGDTLLDPCLDLPAEHFDVDQRGYLRERSRRGAITIEVLDLNRSELSEQRAEVVSFLLSRDTTQRERVEALLPGAPFAGAAWLALLAQLPPRYQRNRRQRPPTRKIALTRLVAGAFGSGGRREEDDGWRPEQNERRRYLRRVTLRNFRGLAEAVLDFPERGKEFTKAAGSVVVLGENGAGKTSLLQAAALGAMGAENAHDAEIRPDFCLTEGETEGEVLVEFWGTRRTNRVTFEAGSTQFGGHTDVPVMVLGYGAYRMSARGELGEYARHYEFRVNSLFKERALVNGAFGLRQHLELSDEAREDRFLDVARALNAVLHGRAKAKLGFGNRLIIDGNGRSQPLDELSSGYKSIVAIATDIMDVMYEVWQGLTSGVALILVDEIDAHLHPSWRLAIVDALRETFPSAQFLMTTHDPLPLRGLGDGEIVVLDRNDSEAILKRPRIRGVNGMTVDQMLTSDLFGLDSTLDRTAAQQLERYYSLLAMPTRSESAERDLEAVEAALPPHVPLGETPRERLMYRVIDRYLARRGPERADALNDQTIDELTDLFEATERETLARDGRLDQ